MNPSSNFSVLAHLVSVSDIARPILSNFDASLSAGDVSMEWCIDLCGENNLDPMDQLCLVTDNGVVVGWVGYDMLDAGKTLAECMDPIMPEAILTSDTSLLDVVEAFGTTSEHFFLVMKGNHFIGWVTYKDLHRPPLRLCLFAMVLNLERILLEIILQHPAESVSCLPPGRKEKALKLYKDRGYQFTDEGEPYLSRLLELTYVVDKFLIVQRTKAIAKLLPAVSNKRFVNLTEKLRNEIAHPKLIEESSSLLQREKLWPYIQWCSELELQLKNYLA